jgi:hypothetical protein
MTRAAAQGWRKAGRAHCHRPRNSSARTFCAYGKSQSRTRGTLTPSGVHLSAFRCGSLLERVFDFRTRATVRLTRRPLPPSTARDELYASPTETRDRWQRLNCTDRHAARWTRNTVRSERHILATIDTLHGMRLPVEGDYSATCVRESESDLFSEAERNRQVGGVAARVSRAPQTIEAVGQGRYGTVATCGRSDKEGNALQGDQSLLSIRLGPHVTPRAALTLATNSFASYGAFAPHGKAADPREIDSSSLRNFERFM